MFLRLIFVMFLVLFQSEKIKINAWPTLQVTIINYTETFNPEYVQYKMVPAEIPGAYDIHVNVRRDNVKIIVSIGIYFENVEFMNKTMDLCKIAHSNREPLLRVIYKVLTENPKSILPKECPVKKGKYYNLLQIETDKIPPVWPERTVQIYIHIFSHELDRLVPVLSTAITCQFNKKKVRS